MTRIDTKTVWQLGEKVLFLTKLMRIRIKHQKNPRQAFEHFHTDFLEEEIEKEQMKQDRSGEAALHSDQIKLRPRRWKVDK